MRGLKIVAIFFVVCALVTSAHASSGVTPSEAIVIGQGEVQGNVVRSMYYSYTALEDGIMNVSLSPIGGSADLAVTHFSGSPAAESRREGMSDEVIALQISQGDRFLIRVSTPLGEPTDFRLSVNLTHGLAPVDLPQVYVPSTNRDASTPEEAIEIPIGKLVAFESYGDRYFKTKVPAGYLVVVSLYPVSGENDLEVILETEGKKFTAASSRTHNVPDRVYIPVSGVGEALIKVSAPKDAREYTGYRQFTRYAIVVRLRHVGLSTGEFEEPDDRSVINQIFPDERVGKGLPAFARGISSKRFEKESKILRLR
ncbi:MAG: hypothetical protein JKX97_01130 [Candidatus Lindowbacteria bacterium]|nr:hypothetical protein [Candidatus Lindowbacteria bacterium]